MGARTSRRTITFTCPFSISGIDGVQPPGTYTVETDDDFIKSLSVRGRRRVVTLISLPVSARRPSPTMVSAIVPAEAGMALYGDHRAKPMTRT